MSTTLPSMMHFPLAVRVAVQSYHEYGRSIAIRRAIWDDDYPHAEATPETKWLIYDGGLFFVIDDDGQRLAKNSDVTEEDFLAWDWTTLPPGCLSDPTIACGADDPLSLFAVNPYDAEAEISYAAFDIQNPNGWLSPCAQACSPLDAPPGVGAPAPDPGDIIPDPADTPTIGGGGGTDGGGGDGGGGDGAGGGGEPTGVGGGGGGGGGGAGGGDGDDKDPDEDLDKPKKNPNPPARPTLTFDSMVDVSPTADGGGGTCTTTTSAISATHGGGTLALSDDGTGDIWNWQLTWQGNVVQNGTIQVGNTASFSALDTITMIPGEHGEGRSWTVYASAYLPGDASKPIEAQYTFWYPPQCAYVGS